MVVVLDNIRSLHNVASVFRTCDAVGAKKLYLCGITPTPLDRLGRVRPPFSKVALGAEENVEWERRASAWRVIDNLKNDGYAIYAVEQDERSVPYYSVKAKKKSALVLGHEVRGLPESVLSRADKILEIPMAGIKESLNISVAFGIVAYSLRYTGK
jgi:23S rRNA (guanosine2251-2'-O)-methyltransferase